MATKQETQIPDTDEDLVDHNESGKMLVENDQIGMYVKALNRQGTQSKLYKAKKA